MTNVDDLARLLVPPPGEDVVIRDAVIREWNPTTFENVVEYEGIRLRNVDVGAGAAIEALTYQPGDIVQLELRFSGGRKGELGIGDVAIRGRRITPGTGAAEKAIGWMTSSLASRLARQLLGEATHVAQVETFESQPHTPTWSDLATPGPTVSDVEIGESGTALVILSARIDINFGSGTGFSGANLMDATMGLEITGATSRSPDPWSSLEKSGQLFTSTGQVTGGAAVNTSKVLVIQGLNPGAHTFTAKYMTIAIPQNTGATAGYSDRLLAVLPL